MFRSSNPNYMKLRTNLRLCINRLKLLEKKKTELALKARREIADYITLGKDERARIRVEHIIREDLMVEAMEIIEMFCDLILARFGLVEKMKELDPGLEECISTLIWAAPRLQTDVQEMKEVAHQLTIKYGKEYADMCRSNGFENVNEKVLIKMGTQPPPKILIENYMIEIARAFNVPFEPDASVMTGNDDASVDNLIDIDDRKGGSGGGGGGASGGGGGASGGGGGGGGGASGWGGGTDDRVSDPNWLPPKPGLIPPDSIPPYMPENDPAPPYSPPRYDMGAPMMHPSAPAPGPTPGPTPGYAPGPTPGPTPGPNPGYAPGPTPGPNPGNAPGPAPGYGFTHGSPAGAAPALPSAGPAPGPHLPGGPPSLPSHPPNAGSNTGIPNPVPTNLPPPFGASAAEGSGGMLPDLPDVPGLPSVPADSVKSAGEDIDFDDLTKRFEELKKRK